MHELPPTSPPSVTPVDTKSIVHELAAVLREAATVPPAELVDAAGAAKMLGVSISKFRAMHDGGRVPAPIELGDRCPRWSVRELRAWIDAGAPTRLRWEALRLGALRRAG